jgi:hypothetical protein
MLRLNLSVPVTKKPQRLGLLAGDKQGFPNGRRLTDDVVDIEVQALEGAAQTGKIVDALAAGDKVNANDNRFGDRFPYLALPNGVAVNSKAGKSGSGVAPDSANGAAGADASPAAGMGGGAPADGPATKPAAFSAAARTPIVIAMVALAGAALVSVLMLLMIRWWRRRTRTVPFGSSGDTLPI